MKRPQRRAANGRFSANPADKIVLRDGHLRQIARSTRKGVLERLRVTEPALAAAHRKFSNELVEEFGGRDVLTASAGALVHVVTQSKLILDTIDAVLLELGAKVVNRGTRAAYPLIKQRMELADSLTQQLAAFNQLKGQRTVEAELERLEDLAHATVR